MASQVEICNLALSHLGISKEIANLTTENSQEASACRRFYDAALDEKLRDFPWPFATKIIALGEVEEDPNDEWDFSYRYPTDCLFFRRILSGVRNDTRQARIPYKLGKDTAGRLVWTDQEDAQGEYTERVADPVLYPPDFTMAFSLLLAAYLAPRLTAGDPFKRQELVLKLYALSGTKAQSTAANEEQPDELPDSEFIRDRG